MRIVVAGMGRAGSSVLWKMVGEILSLNGADIPSGAATKIDEALASDAFLLKWHSYQKRIYDWADLVITPRRDIREVVDSYQRLLPRIKNEEHLRNVCGEAISLYDGWKDLSSYEMVYERFRDNPENAVQEIAGSLGLECSPCQVLDKVGRPPGKKSMVIKEAWVDLIDREYGGWLRKYGYPVPGEFQF